MYKSGKRFRRGRPRRPLINSSPIKEVPDLVPPTTVLRDEEDPIIDALAEVVPEMGIEEANHEVQHDINERDNLTDMPVPPIKKRGRGPAEGTAFDRLRKYGKIPLNIKDGHRGPSCENATIFSSRVSWIIRVHAEMRHASWSAIGDKEKHELITRVRGDFELDWTKENHREAVVNALADKYNAYHYELHKHYRKFATHEEALAGRKESVEPHVWEWLCERWASGAFKERSRRNTNNRKKQKVRHTGGRKSFVRLMEERGEEAPNLIEFYKQTHWSREKGKFINAASEFNYNLMLERLNEKGTEEDQDDDATADVFKEVLGYKFGYALGLGHSVIPEPSPFMQKNKTFKRLAEENERNKTCANHYKTQLESLLGEMADLRKQFSEHDRQINMISSQLESNRESQQETLRDA
ncbi:hypothetical protein I3842_02G047500 [Carya illinoinensis]|uniref:Transposase, Ptta/En/Spm, plant n=1 Tax=Carya illinoinensis TaxID=32201 RepID=A0A922FSB9_CARIL|nr:hypothetical protein I3842_02G047500 [Carya illinoinensis]